MPPKNSGHIPKSHKTTQTPELLPKKTITGNPRNHWVLDCGYAQKPCVGGRLSPPCPSLSPPFTSTLVQLLCIAFTQLSGKTQGQKAARASLLHPSHCRVWDFKVRSEKQAARESSREPNCGTPSVGMLWGMRWERSKGFGPIPSGHQHFPCLQSEFSLCLKDGAPCWQWTNPCGRCSQRPSHHRASGTQKRALRRPKDKQVWDFEGSQKLPRLISPFYGLLFFAGCFIS